MNNRELALEILKQKNCYCFAGGGVLGYAHVGAMLRLYELGGLDNIDKVVGSSVGSIIAAALACGGTSYYIKHKINQLDPRIFRDGGNIFKKAFRFLYQYGIHKGDAVTQFAGEMLEELTGNSDITFLEAYNKYGIHLTITYLSLRYQKTEYADYITTPNIKIKTAIRWSSGIPLFFKAARIYGPLWRINDITSDGGVANNYAMNVLHDQGCDAKNILGFRLCGDVLLQKYDALEESVPQPLIDYGVPRNIFDYVNRLIDILRQQALLIHVKEEDWKLTVKIDIGKYTTTDFDITEDGKAWLLESGKRAIDEHLDDIITLLDRGEYPGY